LVSSWYSPNATRMLIRRQGRQYDRGDFHQQPRHDHVGRAYLEDVSALEFGDQ